MADDLVARLRHEADRCIREAPQLVIEARAVANRLESAEARVRELETLLVRVHNLGQTGGWRHMPDGGLFSSTPLAGDIATAIRKLAQEAK